LKIGVRGVLISIAKSKSIIVRIEVIDKSIETQIQTKEGAAAAIRRHQEDFEKRTYNLYRDSFTKILLHRITIIYLNTSSI